MRIGIILFDGFDELDAIGPYEVFRHAAKLGGDIHVELLTLTEVDEVTASGGLCVRPHGRLKEAPDVVLVPGGGWSDRAWQGAWGEVQRGELTRVLGELHDAGTTVATVCTGGMIAAAAGLTDGRPGTTHHTALDDEASRRHPSGRWRSRHRTRSRAPDLCASLDRHLRKRSPRLCRAVRGLGSYLSLGEFSQVRFGAVIAYRACWTDEHRGLRADR